LAAAFPGGFNPRPRAAGDAGFNVITGVEVVSIHARARRATPPPAAAAESPKRFNPRPRAAGDAIGSARRRAPRMFQSTPARGGRPGAP